MVGDFEGTRRGSRASTSRTPTPTPIRRPPRASSSSPATPNTVTVGDLVRVDGLRPRALQPDRDQRLEQQRRRRHRSTSSTAARGTVAADRRHAAVRDRRPPGALRGHARPLPAAARHRRVLQLRPLRRDRARAPARRARRGRSRGTAIDEPGAPRMARALANSLQPDHARRRAQLQNPASLRHPNGAAFSLDNRFRGGDTVANTVGVLGFDFSLYRIQPTGPADYTAVNPRPPAPEPVGGSLQVAAMNTLNFFLTLDYPTATRSTTSAGRLRTSSAAAPTSTSRREFTRQRDKLLAALAGLDADVIGLNELENTTGRRPARRPDAASSPGSTRCSAPGTYASIDTGVIGTDAIRVGLIYKPAVVTPVGALQGPDLGRRPALHRHAEPAGAGPDVRGERHRRALHGRRQPPQVQGLGLQRRRRPRHRRRPGQLQPTRTQAAAGARRLARHRPDRQRRSRLPDHGRPQLLREGRPDRRDQGRRRRHGRHGRRLDEPDRRSTSGTFAYSYVFDGQAGYLDHALASASTDRRRSPAPPSGTSTPTSRTSSTTTRPSSREHRTRSVRADAVPGVRPRPGDRRPRPRHARRRSGRRRRHLLDRRRRDDPGRRRATSRRPPGTSTLSSPATSTRRSCRTATSSSAARAATARSRSPPPAKQSGTAVLTFSCQRRRHDHVRGDRPGRDRRQSTR